MSFQIGTGIGDQTMSGATGKYDPLKKYLQAQAASRLPMAFSHVEKIIGAKLPRSAKLRSEWWSNNATNHVQAKAWLDAGYRTEHVDRNTATLVFVREGVPHGVAEQGRGFEAPTKRTGPHPMIGAMKGTFSIEEGWDLTKPALDAEELAAWEAKLDRMADELQGTLSRK